MSRQDDGYLGATSSLAPVWAQVTPLLGKYFYSRCDGPWRKAANPEETFTSLGWAFVNVIYRWSPEEIRSFAWERFVESLRRQYQRIEDLPVVTEERRLLTSARRRARYRRDRAASLDRKDQRWGVELELLLAAIHARLHAAPVDPADGTVLEDSDAIIDRWIADAGLSPAEARGFRDWADNRRVVNSADSMRRSRARQKVRASLRRGRDGAPRTP